MSDRGIPVPYRALAATVVERLLGGDPSGAEVAARLEAIAAAEAAPLEEELKDLYRPVGPREPEASSIHAPSLARSPGLARSPSLALPPDDTERCGRFLEAFEGLLTRANYRPLAREELDRALVERSVPGLEVRADLSAYDHLHVFVRGEATSRRADREWRRGGRRRELQVAAHRRVVLAVRLRGEPSLHLKLFQDIPKADIEALLPGITLRMRLGDKIRVGGSAGVAGGSAVWGAIKWAATLRLSLLPLLAVFGLFYGCRALWNFVAMRDRYRTALIRDLYYQTLDNGEGVITRLVDESEEEEAKEALLAWAIGAASPGPVRPDEVRERAEAFLREAHQAEADFDLPDALAKVGRYGLAAGADGVLRMAPPGAAAVALAARQVALAARA